MDSLSSQPFFIILHIGLFVLIFEVKALFILKAVVVLLGCLVVLPFFVTSLKLLFKTVNEPRITHNKVPRARNIVDTNDLNLQTILEIRNKQQVKMLNRNNFDKNSYLLKNNRIEREVGLELELLKYIKEQSRKKGDFSQSTRQNYNSKKNLCF